MAAYTKHEDVEAQSKVYFRVSNATYSGLLHLGYHGNRNSGHEPRSTSRFPVGIIIHQKLGEPLAQPTMGSP